MKATLKNGEAREIARLAREAEGPLTAQAVVDSAKDPKSPLHHRFPWDDKRAANEHRCDIARDLIQEFRIFVKKKSKGKSQAFTVIPGLVSSGRGYLDTRIVMQAPKTAAAQISTEWQHIATRMERLAGLCSISEFGWIEEWARTAKSEGDALVNDLTGEREETG